MLRSREPRIAAQLRPIDMLGPTAIPPIVIAKHVDERTKQRIQEALCTMHHHQKWAKQLHQGLIERLVRVDDEEYDGIRSMWERVNEHYRKETQL